MLYKLSAVVVATLLLGAVYVSGGEPKPSVNDSRIIHSAASSALHPAAPSVYADASNQGQTKTGEVARPALTLNEKRRYLSWMQKRGLEIGLNSAGEEYSLSEKYRSMDEPRLAELAGQGDAMAAQVLAEKLLASGMHGAAGLPERAVQERAIRSLLRASELGYTTSIDRLIDIYRLRAMYVGEPSRMGRPPFDRESLLQAYAYAFLLKKRGDVNEAANFDMLKAVGELSVAEIDHARAAADQLYFQLASNRTQAGLPPFEDGVPSEIEEIGNRVAEEAQGAR